MIDDDFENKLEENQIIPLNKNHLLIEMSYLQPSINFETAIAKITSSGYFPVFAHPERYHYLNKDIRKYSRFKHLGIKFQLNVLSLGGYYGKDVYKTALRLLDQGDYDFIGTDVHNPDHMKAIKSIEIQKNYLDEFLRLKENNKHFFG